MLMSSDDKKKRDDDTAYVSLQIYNAIKKLDLENPELSKYTPECLIRVLLCLTINNGWSHQRTQEFVMIALNSYWDAHVRMGILAE